MSCAGTVSRTTEPKQRIRQEHMVLLHHRGRLQLALLAMYASVNSGPVRGFNNIFAVLNAVCLQV